MAAALVGAVSKARSVPEADQYDVNALAERLIRDRAGDLIADLSATKRKRVASVLAQAQKRGWSDAVRARRLAEVIGLDERRATAVQNHRAGRLRAGVPPWLAERQTQAYAKRLLKDRVKVIAENETRLALMNAQRIVWKQMQDQGDYTTYAVRVTRVHKDERLCPTCGSQNGRRRSLSRDLNEGPPFHPRCRCEEYVEDRGVVKAVALDESFRVEKAKQFPAGDFHAPKKGQKCSRWECGKPAVASRTVRGHEMGACAGHKSEMTVKKVMNTISPGGRPADDSSLDRSPKKNWVENAGGLPKYIRMVANAMMRKGKARSVAIRLAIGIVRNWATHEGVSPAVKAAAVKAMAEWEAKRAGTKVKKEDETQWSLDDHMAMIQQLRQDKVI